MGFDTATRGLRPEVVYNYKREGPTQLAGTSAVKVYYNDTEGIQRFNLWLVNVGAAEALVNVHIVTHGGTAGATNKLFADVPLSGKETLVPPEMITLEGGDEVWIKSDTATAVNYMLAIIYET